jgi:hypothetical protein
MWDSICWIHCYKFKGLNMLRKKKQTSSIFRSSHLMTPEERPSIDRTSKALFLRCNKTV